MFDIAPLIAASMMTGSLAAAPALECEICCNGMKVVACQGYFMVGMLNSAPSLMPDGHRWVMVLVFV